MAASASKPTGQIGTGDITPPPTCAPVVNGSTETLTPQNDSFLSLATRRLRELLLDAQKRRSSGKLTVAVGFTDGNCTGKFGVNPSYEESLSRK